LIIKENYYTDDLHKKLESLNYKITFAEKKFRSIIVQTDGKSDLLEHCLKLEKEGYVESVYPVEPTRECYTPGDPRYLPGQGQYQWYLHKIGMTQAWDHTISDDSLKIAVLDSGIPMQYGSLFHPEFPNNGRIILGKNYVPATPNDNMADDRGHGTMVAGIIGAEKDSNGIVGICFNSKLIIYKVTDSNGVIGNNDNNRIYNALKDAISKGCKIINMSFGQVDDPNNTYKNMVEYARDRNVLIVAGAGNVQPSNSAVIYPAKYASTYDNVIAVSATDSNDIFAYTYSGVSGSCSGSQVTLSAPGVDIYTTMPNYPVVFNGPSYNLPQEYAQVNGGTSYATPIVTGVAGLVWSKYPNYTATQVKQHLIATAKDIDVPGFDVRTGHGRVDAHNAVKTIFVPAYYPTLQMALDSRIHPDDNITVTSGTHIISQPVTIPAGATLRIEGGATVNFSGNLTINGRLETEGATLKFATGKGIIIYGSANCSGTTFTGITQYNNWSGISLYPGSSKNFNDCKISYSVYGFNIHNTSEIYIKHKYTIQNMRCTLQIMLQLT